MDVEESKFTELPLELKILILEKNPYNLKKLLLLDHDLYETITITEHGTATLSRILQKKVVCTKEEKGTFILGKKHGRWESYYLSGRLHKVDYYKLGVLEGTTTQYSENGHFYSDTVYTIYGKIKDVTSYHYDIKYVHEIYKELDDNNDHETFLYKTLNYSMGRLHGDKITYHQNGQIQLITPYKMGKIYGHKIRYDDTGNPMYNNVAICIPHVKGLLMGKRSNYLPQ